MKITRKLSEKMFQNEIYTAFKTKSQNPPKPAKTGNICGLKMEKKVGTQLSQIIFTSTVHTG